LSACQSKPAPATYSGTIVVGADYVQALVTAPGDRACPPRTQRVGHCVKTPKGCDNRPPCVTRMEVRSGDRLLASSRSSLVRTERMPALITIIIDGCGGRFEQTVKLRAVPPLASASATVGESIALRWDASSPGHQVCALWRGSGGVQVCCVDDVGKARFPTPRAGIDDVRLSRGVKLSATAAPAKTVEIFRTSETGNLL